MGKKVGESPRWLFGVGRAIWDGNEKDRTIVSMIKVKNSADELRVAWARCSVACIRGSARELRGCSGAIDGRNCGIHDYVIDDASVTSPQQASRRYDQLGQLTRETRVGR